MIRYSVQCSHGHLFDEWFDNSADYEVKAAAAAITCPDCGDTAVRKAIMAPNLGKSAPPPQPACPAGGCQGGSCAFANGF